MSVHGPDLSDCGSNAGFGYVQHGAVVLLGVAHVLLDTDGAAEQHCCFCCLPVLLNSAADVLEIAVGFDPTGAGVTVDGSAEVGSLLHHLLLLLLAVAAVSWNESTF